MEDNYLEDCELGVDNTPRRESAWYAHLEGMPTIKEHVSEAARDLVDTYFGDWDNKIEDITISDNYLNGSNTITLTVYFNLGEEGLELISDVAAKIDLVPYFDGANAELYIKSSLYTEYDTEKSITTYSVLSDSWLKTPDEMI